MEKTVFDFNVTDKELNYLKITKDKNKYLSTETKMKKMFDLNILFIIRGDEKGSTNMMGMINDQVVNPSI